MKSAVLLFSLSLPLLGGGSFSLVLSENGTSSCRILVSAEASAADLRAAEILRIYLKRIAAADLPVSCAADPAQVPFIRIAGAGRSGPLPLDVDWSMLEEDGFWIKTCGNGLFILGGSERGTIYGVCSFLESCLGCRKYSAEVEFVPRCNRLVIGELDVRQVPWFKFRDASMYDPGYMEWHKLDDHNLEWGMYVHTFRQLVPADKYFPSHPEYFSLLPGGRVPDGQLCLTNPSVFSIVVEELRRRMDTRPGARYWSVSQNDTFSNCTCADCQRIDEAEGTPAGSLLAFVNRVAASFPDRIVSTLAYQYTRAAPRTIRPAANVNIILCSIECNRSLPIASDPASASFRRDVDDWARLTRNIYLWDYVVRFRNLISPFPNLRVLQPNIQYFAGKGIRALFEQGPGALPCEFKELRTYLIAKLLWDPDADVAAIMDDFLGGYYGAAAPHIRRYIDAMHDALAASGENLEIYGFPMPTRSGYFAAANMDRYEAFFDQAEAAVRRDAVLLRRVRIARLPLQFALLEQAKIYGTAERGFFVKTRNGAWQARRRMMDLLHTFTGRCRRFGIHALDEQGTTPDRYLAATNEWLKRCLPDNLALFKPVGLKTPASDKYGGGGAALTDGLRGGEDYHFNWIGFEAEDLEATIDLSRLRTVRDISIGFHQDTNAWIFLPLQVEFAVSADGRNFRELGVERPAVPADRQEAFSVDYRSHFAPLRARYVRIRALNMKTCPGWHKGAGGKAWIFSDEVVVK